LLQITSNPEPEQLNYMVHEYTPKKFKSQGPFFLFLKETDEGIENVDTRVALIQALIPIRRSLSGVFHVSYY